MSTEFTDVTDEDFQKIEVENDTKAIAISQPSSSDLPTDTTPIKLLPELKSKDPDQLLIEECSELSNQFMQQIKKWSEEIKQGKETFEQLPIAPYLQEDALMQVKIRRMQWQTHVKAMIAYLQRSVSKPNAWMKIIKFCDVGDRVVVKWGPSGRAYAGSIGSCKLTEGELMYCVHFDDGDVRTYSEEELIKIAAKKEGEKRSVNCHCK